MSAVPLKDVTTRLRQQAELMITTANNLEKIQEFTSEVNIERLTSKAGLNGALGGAAKENRLSEEGRARIIEANRKKWMDCPQNCGKKHRKNHPHMKSVAKAGKSSHSAKKVE